MESISTLTSPGYKYNTRHYIAENTWYNASNATYLSKNGVSTGSGTPATDQFMNPYIIMYIDANTNTEHVHVSYYDTKDGSIKYRYNKRNAPGTIARGPLGWTNLDGGWDYGDTMRLQASSPDLAPFGTDIAAASDNFDGRIVNYNTRKDIPESARPDVGEHNAIAVTAEEYPVVAYYDSTKQRLKLAVSRSTTPFAARQGNNNSTTPNWTIRDNVIPAGMYQFGTGQYVNMRIDTRAGPARNHIHIAALNSINKHLVYITGVIHPQNNNDGVLNDVTVQVVDSVGDVGRWSTVSLDCLSG